MTQTNERNTDMTESWEGALRSYAYPVDLRKFKYAGKFPGWFEKDLVAGCPSETTAFEDRFRKLAPHHLEAWYEVVFWKMYSQEFRRDAVATRTITNVEKTGVSASDLWGLCHEYMDTLDKKSFRNLRNKLFGYMIATAATFPAFIDPLNFPMVDTQVARWARTNASRFSYAQVGGPLLLQGPEFGRSATALDDRLNRHWNFVMSWYEWCRFTAELLSDRTDRTWRARDVEMAVFHAQRSGLDLSPLDAQ